MMMMEFLEILKIELRKEFPPYEIEIGALEDGLIGRLPSILIVPGNQSRLTSGISNRDTNVGFTINVFEQHIPEILAEEISMCEEIIKVLEENLIIKNEIVKIDTNLNYSIQKEEDDLNGIFIGKINVSSQLCR